MRGGRRLLGTGLVAVALMTPATAVAAVMTPPDITLSAGKQLIHGKLSGSVGTLVGGAASTVISSATTALSLAAISAFVVSGAPGVLHQAAAALGTTTRPHLQSTWFSSTYWRMTAIATLLTLPFLFAAAIQALIRSDVALLAKAAFGYLPLAMLAIGIAAPLTTLVLSACDQLCSFISSAAGNESAHFLAKASLAAAALGGLTGSPFLGLLVSLFIIATAFALWIELLLREAAVYVIVLMLPLAFAAFVWPARRIWAIRAVELLVALILSKFAIVAVLSLGGAAVSATGSLTGLMAGAVLIMLAAFSPWVLLRLIPLAELASGVGELRAGLHTGDAKEAIAEGRAEWLAGAAANMRQQAESRLASMSAPRQTSDDESDTSAASENAAAAPEAPRDLSRSADDDPAPHSVAENWAQSTVLDLENVGSTRAWPHEDAE